MQTEVIHKTRRQVEDARVAAIAKMAAHNFRNHSVRQLYRADSLVGEPQNPNRVYAGWRCKDPASWAHGFDVFSFPGRLMVTGDIGLMVWEREENMLAWANSSLASIDYFAGKVVQEIKTKEYDRDCVVAWMHEVDQDILNGEIDYDSRRAKMWLTEVRDAVKSAVDDGEHEVMRVICDSGFEDGCDMPSFDNWRYDFLWAREAVRWFLYNHYYKSAD